MTSEQASGVAPSCEQGLGRDYARLWSAATVSSFGDGVVLVAFPLLAASLTRSPLLVAGALFAVRLPWLVTAPFSGVLADRWSRVRLMQAADLCRATVFAVLAVALLRDMATLPLVYAAGFLAGSADTLHTSSTQAVLPRLVDERQLSRANGRLLGSMTAVEHMVGPALGGVLFASLAAGPFVFDVATFLASAVVLVPLATRVPAPKRSEASPVLAELRAGFSAFWRSPVLRVLSLLMAGLAFGQAMAMGVLVLFALDVLGLSSAGFGLLLGVSALGNVLGSLVAARAEARWGTATVLVWTAFVSGTAYLVLGIVASGPSFAVILLAVEALAVATGSVVSLTVRQTAVPNHLLGRVSACFRTVMWGALPLGTLVGGAVAEVAGIRAPIAVAGGLQLVVVAVAAVPLVRNMGARPAHASTGVAEAPRSIPSPVPAASGQA